MSQEHTKHAGNGQFLNIDFIFKTKFKPVTVHSYLVSAILPVLKAARSFASSPFLHTAAYDATEDRSPRLCPPFASLLSPISATEAKAQNSFMALQVTMETGWPHSSQNTVACQGPPIL